MIYIITNKKTGKEYQYQFQGDRIKLKSWLINSSSKKSTFEIFREIGIFGISNFSIESEDENRIRKSSEAAEKRFEVEYKTVENGKPKQTKKKKTYKRR